MTLQEKIKADLKTAILDKNVEKKEALRVVLGEFGRQASKTLADDDVVKIIRKLVKAEKELLEKQKAPQQSAYITILESYLPQMATEAQITAWIQANIDFSQYKNKMQAMGAIMKHFGPKADGNAVRQILQKQ